MNSKYIVIKELKRDMSTSKTIEFNKVYLLDSWLGRRRGYSSGVVKRQGGVLYSVSSNKKYIVISLNGESCVDSDYQKVADDFYLRKSQKLDSHVTDHQKVKNCLLKLDKKYKSLVEAARSKDELFQELQHLIGADL